MAKLCDKVSQTWCGPLIVKGLWSFKRFNTDNPAGPQAEMATTTSVKSQRTQKCEHTLGVEKKKYEKDVCVFLQSSLLISCEVCHMAVNSESALLGKDCKSFLAVRLCSHAYQNMPKHNKSNFAAPCDGNLTCWGHLTRKTKHMCL